MVELTTMQLIVGIMAQLIGVAIAAVKISNAIDKRFDDLAKELNAIRIVHIGDISAQKSRLDVLETRVNAIDAVIQKQEKTFSDIHGYLVQNSDFKPRR